jgi:hypothetical protein
MAEGDAYAASAAASAASPRTPAPPETPSTQKRRQRGLVSRVWKGIFGRREDVEKLLQALSKEEEAVRSRLRRRARASRQSAHNVLAIAAALEVSLVPNSPAVPHPANPIPLCFLYCSKYKCHVRPDESIACRLGR